MKLPNLDRAVVSTEKILGYLLSATHSTGRHKARFFERFGFSRAAPELLAQSLREHARSNDITASERSQFGARYIIDGGLNSPDGRKPQVRVIWFVEAENDVPYLVTVYPIQEARA